MSGYVSLPGDRKVGFDVASPCVDAFARLRQSSPHTEFDAKALHDNLPLLFDDQEESGSGTSSAHSTDTAQVTLQVSATTAGTRTRQTFRRFNYQPGKSQLIILTGCLPDGAPSGITARMGYFDDDNGIFFEAVDGTIYATIRSSTSGSPVDTQVAQADWNMDKLDGTGPSNATLDATKNQILWFDFEWLGAGQVRFGFFIKGEPVVAHIAYHANQGSELPYMSTPNLPLRYQIINDGTAAQTRLLVGCQTVISEAGGEDQDVGVERFISNGNTHIDATTGGTKYALMGIRLKSTHLDTTIKLINIQVMALTADNIEWELLLNPSVAGPPSWGNETNSALQTFYGATANTVTGGTSLAGGYVAGSRDGGIGEKALDNEILLGAAIDGTVDEMVLVGMPIGSGTINADILGGIEYRELA